MSDLKDDSGMQQPEVKELEVNKDPNFIGEFANMDLNPIKDKKFLVAVRTGDPEKGRYLPTTIKGPYDFYEMVEEVAHMWNNFQHHACVYFANKDRDKKNEFLDRNTIDYIEANYADLITEGLITGVFDDYDPSHFDCTVGVNQVEDDELLGQDDEDEL